MPPFLRRLSTSSTVTQWLLLGGALLLLGAATGFHLYIEHERTEQREETRLLAQTHVLHDNIEQNLASISKVLADLRRDQVQTTDPRQLNRRMQTLVDAMPGVRTLLWLDASGMLVASNRPELIGQNFAYRDYFATARQNPDPDVLFVSQPFTTALGIFGITISRAVSGPHGEFAGIVSATLDPEYFRTLMESVLYAPDMLTAISHGDGIQFLMMPEQVGQAGKNLAQPGSFFSIHRDSGKQINTFKGKVYATGDERILVVRSIQTPRLKQDKPLILATGRRLDMVFAAWRRDLRIQSGLFALIVLVSTFGLYAAQRRQRQLTVQEAAAADALAANARFMKTLTDNLPGMVAYWNRDLRCEFANQAYFEWFGKTPQEMMGIRIQDLMGETLFKKNEPYILAVLRGERQRFERTLTKIDGSVGYTWAQYIPDRDGDVVRGFFVLVADITELKRTEIALRESETKLKAIIETEPECVKILDRNGTLLQMNRAGLDMVEADTDAQVLGHQLTEIVAPEYRDAFLAVNDKVIHGDTGSLVFEIIGLKGGRRWLDTHAVPMRNAEGDITGVLAVTRDITAQKKIEQELQEMAQTDFLTGLTNRRHFMLLAEQELSRTLRYGGALSILMLDIDHFKQINDAFGHKYGDVVLQRFAAATRQGLRDIDILGRIGGEEFAVVLPQTDSNQAQEVAERLRLTAADTEVEIGSAHGDRLHFTVSIGVASLAGVGVTIDMLLSQADLALYQAKNSGRNRVCVYTYRDDLAVAEHAASDRT